jgi:hypothetical protein
LERIAQKRARKAAAVFIFLLAVVLLQDRVRVLYHGLNSTHWPIVSGTVIDVDSQRVGDFRGTESWSFSISYSYVVNDVESVGSRVRFSRAAWQYSQEDVERLWQQFQPGATVDVYVHPRRHHLSVLQPGVDRSAALGLVLSLLLIGVAVVFWQIPTRMVRSGTKK